MIKKYFIDRIKKKNVEGNSPYEFCIFEGANPQVYGLPSTDRRVFLRENRFGFFLNNEQAHFCDGVFSNSSENMTLKYLSSPPNTNPLWTILVQNVRNDYVISDVFAESIVALNDPRSAVYFDTNISTFTGGVYGATNEFPDFTHIGTTFNLPDLEGLLLSYSEVSFYLAEAAQKGFNVGSTSAKDYYEAGIKASMDYWGIDSTLVDAYLLEADVIYNPANWRSQIGTQLWIASFNRGFEGWSAIRKYDFKTFAPAIGSGENIPNRFKYPQTEQNINNSNLNAAAAAMPGGDSKATKIFWDKN